MNIALIDDEAAILENVRKCVENEIVPQDEVNLFTYTRAEDFLLEWVLRLFFIKIENSVCEAPVMKDGRPVSVKQDKMRHGYGLKSVERIVNKYEGMIMYQSKDQVFQVKLLF